MGFFDFLNASNAPGQIKEITPSNNPLDSSDIKINNLVTNNKNLDKIKVTLSDGTVASIAPNNDFFTQDPNENLNP